MTDTTKNGGPPDVTKPPSEVGMVKVQRGEDFSLALEPRDGDSAFKLAAFAFKAGMGGVKSEAEALMRIMAGRSLGITSMQSLQFVYHINGKTGLDATLVRGLVLQHPACEEFACIETTNEKATFRAKRRGQDPVTLSWTIDEARRAKLLSKDVWQQYPAAMLRARATSDLAKLVFPEAVSGMPCKEELEDVAYTQGAVQHVESTHTVVSQGDSEPLAGSEARDYDAEVAALRNEINAACGPAGTKEMRKAVRDKITASDLPDAEKKAVGDAYNEAMVVVKEQAKKAKEAAATAPTEPAPPVSTPPAVTP